ncbi:type II toxin-antitoxin system VapC family toxin [Sorangium sp. So ce1099]|uniref:type II toxin-antitoxin system VapC family toxin n=1 Tax=Sorangium sp. So ce1099 TaxID=3133331 RepID=UPI003F648E13
MDTNIVSELRKEARCDPGVSRWLDAADEDDLFMSVLTLGEVRMGALGLARRNPAGAARVQAWVDALHSQYAGRILPVSLEIAETWARLSVPDRLPAVDGLLDATAIVHNLTLVTRNTRDVARTGVKLINPFDESSSHP